MTARCSGCASERGVTAGDLGCLECGAPCCPACAVVLEAAGYCRACARALVGSAWVAGAGPIELQ